MASAHTAASTPDSRANLTMCSVKSTATGSAPGHCARTRWEKSPVPHARSRTSGLAGSLARLTPRRFQPMSIPYENSRVIRS